MKKKKTRISKLYKSGVSRTAVISTQRKRRAMSSVVKWSCLLIMTVLLMYFVGPAVGSTVGAADLRATGTAAVGTAASTESQWYDRSCATAATGPVTCLLKRLMKNAVLYVTRRRHGLDTAETNVTGPALHPKGIEDYLFDQIQNIIGMFSFGFELPTEVTAPWAMLKSSFFNVGRGKKNKNMGPMLAAGAAMIVGTLVPLAFGTLFMLAGKAVMTSMLAITISGMLGLKTLFGGKSESIQAVKSLSAPMTYPAHYNSEALYEHESTAYNNKAKTESKIQDPGTDFFTGESNNNRGYYNKPEQPYQSVGGGIGDRQPIRVHWDAANSAKSIDDDGDFNKITAAAE